MSFLTKLYCFLSCGYRFFGCLLPEQVALLCVTTSSFSPPSLPWGRSLGRLATLWVMCLRWGLWPKALHRTDINPADGFICFGTSCVRRLRADAHGCVLCVPRFMCGCVRVSKRFTVVNVAIYLSSCSLQHTLLVSIKCLSGAVCPPVLCLYNVHLYATWDHFGNSQSFHLDQQWQAQSICMAAAPTEQRTPFTARGTEAAPPTRRGQDVFI